MRAALDGCPIRQVGCACSAPDIPRFEIDFRLPAGVSAGRKKLECWLGRRYLGATEIEVIPDRFWWRIHPTELYQAFLRFLRERQDRGRREANGSGYNCS